MRTIQPFLIEDNLLFFLVHPGGESLSLNNTIILKDNVFTNIQLQGYPQRMRLQRRFYGIFLTHFSCIFFCA